MWPLLIVAALAEDLEEGDDLDVPEDARKPPPSTGGFQTAPGALDLGEDDAGMADFAAEHRRRPPPPDRWHVDPAGVTPLTDAFEIQIAALDARTVVAELPVLVAQGRDGFLSAHPAGLVLTGVISSGAARQEVVVHVGPGSVQDQGPTLVFLKAALPDPSATGEVRVEVRAMEGVAPSGPGGLLFARTARFSRG